MRIITDITTKTRERFFRYVRKGDSDGCWEWTASKNRRGYGHFGINGISLRAHRVSWVIHRSPIPDGMLVLHRCDNPSCTNPDHLFLGTNYDNVMDRVKKGRSAAGYNRKNIARGELSGMSVLTWSEVREIRAKYKPRKYSSFRLALEYKVDRSTIGRIVRNKTWIE